MKVIDFIKVMDGNDEMALWINDKEVGSFYTVSAVMASGYADAVVTELSAYDDYDRIVFCVSAVM